MQPGADADSQAGSRPGLQERPLVIEAGTLRSPESLGPPVCSVRPEDGRTGVLQEGRRQAAPFPYSPAPRQSRARSPRDPEKELQALVARVRLESVRWIERVLCRKPGEEGYVEAADLPSRETPVRLRIAADLVRKMFEERTATARPQVNVAVVLPAKSRVTDVPPEQIKVITGNSGQ